MTGYISIKERRLYYILIALCILVYLSGWFVPLMEIDAAQYANISREMLLHKSFLQVYDQGKDYLDKPPMDFWLGSLSMYLFGIHDWAYRLPSFIFSIVAVYSTYKLVLLYYNERIAWLSALVLASCQAMFLINHDVRTDTMLMGWVTLTIWQLAAWLKTSIFCYCRGYANQRAYSVNGACVCLCTSYYFTAQL
jgi:4-amino-4-deoxy-L-arabinose transferase-like glycosyltransferase